MQSSPASPMSTVRQTVPGYVCYGLSSGKCSFTPPALLHLLVFFPLQTEKEEGNVSLQPRKQELAQLYFTGKLTNKSNLSSPRELNLFAAGLFYLQLASVET